ncbi:PEGA domain-containing protein [Candidatus Latescibacterota bacterium]
MNKTGSTLILCVVLVLFEVVLPQLSYAQGRDYGLAVLDLQANNIAEAEALTLSDVLRSSILNVIQEQAGEIQDSYKLIERSQMDRIFDEFDVQNTGCSDISCAIEFGQMLNAERIIIGSVGLVGSTYIVVARIVDVESANMLVSVNRNVPSPIDNVIDLMPLVGHELLTGERLAAPVISTPVTPAPGTQQPARSYPVQTTDSFLSVSGIPEGADVFLNNKKIGETPIDYWKMTPGRYTVKIAHAGYEGFEEEIVIPPGLNKSLPYKLTAYATLSFIGSPAGASVILEGKEIGETPLSGHKVPQGIYSVMITHDGFVDFKKNVVLSPSQETTFKYALTAIETISVTGFPEEAKVSINGKVVGRTPLENYTVSEGIYNVNVTCMGYELYRETVTVNQGSPVELSYHLLPKTKRRALKRSLIFPGSGQRYAEYRGKGTLITILQLATIGGAVATSLSAQSAWSDYDDAETAYKTASIGADFSVLYSDLDNKHETASFASNLQMITIGTAAAVYLYNVIDALMTEPKVEVKPKFNSLRIEPGIGKEYASISVSVGF